MLQRIGRYEVRSELARGGMGVVLRAHDPALGQDVAIKVLLGGAGSSEHQRKRFAREAAALMKLGHPGIVAVRDAGQQGELPFLVMDLVLGETLEDRVLDGGPLAPHEAVKIAEHVARALHHAHGQQVVHRDVKPANVLLDAQGAPRLTDFGLALELDASQSRTALSAAGALLGTPGFLPPEQAWGHRDKVGPPSDVYGLGATLYFMLTRQPPHQAESLIELAAAVAVPPPPPSKLRPEVDAELDEIVLRCMATEPADRYATAEELARALMGWRRSGAERARQRAQRRRAAGLAGAAAAIVMALALALHLGRGSPHGPSPGVAAPTSAAATPTSPTSPARPVARPPTTEEARARARDAALAIEDPLERAKLLERHVADDPLDAEALELLGHARAAADQPEAASEAWSRALAIEPGRESARDARRESVRATARALMAQRELPAAVRLLEQQAADDPEDAAGLELLGDAWAASESAAGALDAWSRALAIDPELPNARLRRAVVRKATGDAPGALEDARVVLRLAPPPGVAVAWAILGWGLAGTGDARAAIEPYETALGLEPRAEWSLELGHLRFGLDDFEGAARDFAGAANLDEADWLGLVNLAACLERLGGRDEELVAALDEAVRRGGEKSALPWIRRGEQRGRADELELALADFDRALALMPDGVDAVLGRATTLRRLGRLAEASRDVEHAMQLAPGSFDVRYHRGLVLEERGERAAAIAEYDVALSIRPDSRAALCARGCAKELAGDIEGALADFAEAERLEPASSDPPFNRGSMFLRLERLEEARAQLDRAVALEPTFAVAYLNRADALKRLGLKDLALADLERCMQLDPGELKAWAARALILYDLDPRRALLDFDTYLSRAPDTPAMRLNRGLCKEKLGDLPGARADFEGAMATPGVAEDTVTKCKAGIARVDRKLAARPTTGGP